MEKPLENSQSSAEKGPESIPTKESVLAAIALLSADAVVKKEESDELGLKTFEVEIKSQKPGLVSRFEYERGKDIFLMHYEDELPTGAEPKLTYNPASGQ